MGKIVVWYSQSRDKTELSQGKGRVKSGKGRVKVEARQNQSRGKAESM